MNLKRSITVPALLWLVAACGQPPESLGYNFSPTVAGKVTFDPGHGDPVEYTVSDSSRYEFGHRSWGVMQPGFTWSGGSVSVDESTESYDESPNWPTTDGVVNGFFRVPWPAESAQLGGASGGPSFGGDVAEASGRPVLGGGAGFDQDSVYGPAPISVIVEASEGNVTPDPNDGSFYRLPATTPDYYRRYRLVGSFGCADWGADCTGAWSFDVTFEVTADDVSWEPL